MTEGSGDDFIFVQIEFDLGLGRALHHWDMGIGP